MKTVAREPTQRFRSVEDFIEALNAPAFEDDSVPTEATRTMRLDTDDN